MPRNRTALRLPAALAAAALLLAACGSRRPAVEDAGAGLALAVAGATEQDVVLWTADSEGRLRSWWLRGDDLSNRPVGAVEGLVLPLGGRVWVWREEQVQVALCDCEAWTAGDLEGTCPPSGETARGTFARLEDLVTGELLELLPAPVTETADGPAFADFGFGMEPVGAVGPYLFVRGHERSLGCGAAHHFAASTFAVIDLISGAAVDILSADERAAIEAGEREAAFAAMRGDPLVPVRKAADLELTAIEPTWVTGIGLRLRYQFTAGASFADSDGNWGSYSRSISVPARGLPLMLLPFAPLPPVLETAVLPAGEPRVAGVAVAEGTPEQLSALAALFGRGE
jgi:hypothetical protein